MKKKKPIYMWQCIKCKEHMYSEETFLKHCNKLTMWVAGIEGIGCNMSEKVKIHVKGYIEIDQENFDILLSHDDVHMSLVYAIPMGYCDASHIEFIVPD